LNRSNLVDDVKMVSVVYNLVESARKLLSWLHYCLDLDIGHFEGFCKGVCLLLEHIEGCLNHELLKLVMNHLYLTDSLVVRL